MIRAHGWSMTSLADLTLGQPLKSAIAEMVAHSIHAIAFIEETDCQRSIAYASTYLLEMEESPLKFLEMNSCSQPAHLVIPVISCEWETYSKAFPNFAKLSSAHIEDDNLEERLIKTIEMGKNEFREKAKVSTGMMSNIYICFEY